VEVVAKPKLQQYWEDGIEYVYYGGTTIFVVKEHRVIGMILLYTEETLLPSGSGGHKRWGA
jgi:hypothetical protein